MRVSWFYSIAADCSQSGWRQMRVRFLPVAGELGEFHGLGHLAYPRPNVRHLCNAARHLGDVVTYRAPRDFVGTDHFTIDVIFPDGRAAVQSVDVGVR